MLQTYIVLYETGLCAVIPALGTALCSGVDFTSCPAGLSSPLIFSVGVLLLGVGTRWLWCVGVLGTLPDFTWYRAAAADTDAGRRGNWACWLWDDSVLCAHTHKHTPDVLLLPSGHQHIRRLQQNAEWHAGSSTRTKLGRRSFPVAAKTVWNSLPAHLRSTLISRKQFRDGLKSHLFADAYFWSSELIEQGLTSHQTHYRSYWGRFLQVI